MVKIENHCCDCAVPGYPCRGSACSRRHVEVHYCDKCDSEIPDGDINEVDGCEYCDDCYDELYEV